jgi:inhibitor of growth protein 3
MAPSRSQASNINSVYTLSLLSEYNHTLDSLPLDLSRNFADLRELDAVLSSSMASIIVKIRNLTQTIEDGSVSKQDRLILLADIADEAARLKLGGEDKIRVACQASDNLKGHIDHMRILLGQIPSFDASVLNKRTTYPHISTRSYMPIPENSRRKRGNYGSIMNSAPDVSPVKRKRNPRDDDIDVAGAKSPRKDNKFGDAGPSRSRNGVRSRRQVHPLCYLTVT